MKHLKKLFIFLFLLTCLFGISKQSYAAMSVDGNSYVVETNETWTSKTMNVDVFIPQDVTLTTSGTTTIYGDVYIFGTLCNTGTLTVEGTLNCLNYSSFSAGNYSHGILRSSGTMRITTLNVKDDYLSTPIPSVHVHTWEEYYTTKETCFTNWTKTYYCTGCDETKTKTITPTGHDYGEWHIDNADCGYSGEKYRYCMECGYEDSIILPATGAHTWGNWTVIEDADCLNEGTEERYCSICYACEERPVKSNPNNHDFSKWTVTRRATALKKGIKARYCYTCEYKETASIKKLKAKVTLKKKSVTIKKKKSYTLKIKSKTYGDKIKKWTTSNKKIATVNKKGKVTGKKKGTAYITLYMKSGAKVKCKVKVK